MNGILFSSYSLKDKVLYYESIANMLEGGVTLLRALKGFRERLLAGSFRDVIDTTIFFIEGGDSLNIAMRKIPDFFTEKEIAIIEAGEHTGLLAASFGAISRELRMQEELRRKVMGALTYPFIIFFFLILALIVVMVYVIPQIMPMILDMSSEIPWSTKTLVATSQFFEENFLSLLIGLLAGSLIFLGFIRTQGGRHWIDGHKITLPVVGLVYKNYLIVQLMNTFSLLMSSGVSILQSLKLTGGSSGNSIVLMMFDHIAKDVAKGKKLTESLREADPYAAVFTPDIIQMIESAEKTSTVATTTQKIGEQYRREVDSALAILVRYIEPIALLFAGLFVLWFAVAIFSAIMQVVTIAGS